MQKPGFEPNLDERRVCEDFDRCDPLPTRMATRLHFDMSGMMTLDREREMDLTRFLEPPDDEPEIGFSDAVFTERATQSFPDRLGRCKHECARRIHIESMNDTRSQAPLSDSDHIFAMRNNRIQDRVVLLRS